MRASKRPVRYVHQAHMQKMLPHATVRCVHWAGRNPPLDSHHVQSVLLVHSPMKLDSHNAIRAVPAIMQLHREHLHVRHVPMERVNPYQVNQHVLHAHLVDPNPTMAPNHATCARLDGSCHRMVRVRVGFVLWVVLNHWTDRSSALDVWRGDLRMRLDFMNVMRAVLAMSKR